MAVVMKPMPTLTETQTKRFWAKVSNRDGEGCWVWTGKTGHNGYGELFIRNSKFRAHRLAYSMERGPVPVDHLVCHRCDNPLCVRPDHLFLGTNQDNIRDCMAKGRRVNVRMRAASRELLRELKHLVSLMEPYEEDGTLRIAGLATLNGARAAIAKAELEHSRQ